MGLFAMTSVFGFLLAFLWREIPQSQILEEELRRTRDDSRRSLLLSQKNKALEKQDYEIYNATLKGAKPDRQKITIM